MIASSQLRSGSRISLPREHGGYLALLAAAVSGIAIAPRPWAALGVGLVVTSAFLLRGPVERASHAPLRAWDAPMSGLLVGVGFGGVWLAGPDWPAPMLLLALGLPACTAWARRHRLGRHPGFELLSMAGLGVAGGAVAWFGGASAPTAAALALVLGLHAGLSVPLVRHRVRKQSSSRSWLFPAAAALLAVALAVVVLGEPYLVLALVPRTVQLTFCAVWRRPRTSRARTIGFMCSRRTRSPSSSPTRA